VRSLVYRAPRSLVLEERPHPALVPGEVIARVEAVGVCGSELHGYLGHDTTRQPGFVFGHEVAGRIVESSDPRHPVGTLVACNSAWHCGRCEFCLQGRDNLCLERKSIGKWRPGGFSDFIALPVSMLIDVPQDFDPVQVALVEPIATPLHGIHRALPALARPLPEARCLVLGGGAIGFIAALLLRRYGVSDLTVIEPNAARRALVAKYAQCSVADVAPAPQPDACELVFDAVGSAATFATAMAAVRRGGVIAEVGLNDAGVALDIQRLVRSGITVVGGANYPAIELVTAVRLIADGLFPDLDWVEVKSLADGPAVFEALVAGHPYPKVVLRP
jgi:alcohol dehydrogenase